MQTGLVSSGLRIPWLTGVSYLPKLTKRTPAVLDDSNLQALFERARNTRLYPFLVVAAATGCRRGELPALQWADLDDNSGLITISKSLEQTRAGGLRVKNEVRGAATIWACRNHNLIFCQPNGRYYPPDRSGARVVELIRKVGLEGVSLHSLRHSHASILLSKGVPAAVVAERLGHADQNITLSIYKSRIACRRARHRKSLERLDGRSRDRWSHGSACDRNSRACSTYPRRMTARA